MSDRTRIRIAALVTALFLAVVSAAGLAARSDKPAATSPPVAAAATATPATLATPATPATQTYPYDGERDDEPFDEERDDDE